MKNVRYALADVKNRPADVLYARGDVKYRLADSKYSRSKLQNRPVSLIVGLCVSKLRLGELGLGQL